MVKKDEFVQLFQAALDEFKQSFETKLATLVAVDQAPTPKTEPDPGEGWRLIDKRKDKPQKGDEVWCPDGNWRRRIAPKMPFFYVESYRRRIELKYREPTNADIGKMVEASDNKGMWYPVKLCCVLVDDYEERYATAWDSEYYTWKHARIRCDGGNQ